MKTIAKKTTLAIKTSIKAGGLGTSNHNRGLKVRAGVKAGGLTVQNHSRALA